MEVRFLVRRRSVLRKVPIPMQTTSRSVDLTVPEVSGRRDWGRPCVILKRLNGRWHPLGFPLGLIIPRLANAFIETYKNAKEGKMTYAKLCLLRAHIFFFVSCWI